MPIIKLPGATKPKPKAKAKAKPKAAPKPAPAKSKAKPKPAAKSKAKPKPRAKRAATAAQTNGGEQRIAKDGRVLRMPKDLDPAVLARFEGQLSEAGERVKNAKAEHDAAIDHVHSVVVQAQDAEIPMAIIEDITGISRQWLYKMSTFKGRAGNGKAKKPPSHAENVRAAKAAKAKPAAKPAKPSRTAKRAASAANKTAKRGGVAIKLA